MGTKEAFKQLCENQPKCAQLGKKDNTRKSYLRYLSIKDKLSTDKMEEWLLKANYTVTQEKLWQVK